jgi:hypothetical protein
MHLTRSSNTLAFLHPQWWVGGTLYCRHPILQQSLVMILTSIHYDQRCVYIYIYIYSLYFIDKLSREVIDTSCQCYLMHCHFKYCFVYVMFHNII